MLRRSTRFTFPIRPRYLFNRNNSTPPPILFTDNLASNTLLGLGIYARLAKYTLISLFGVGVVTWTAFEGAHLYVENMELASENDGEALRWEWHQEAERWSGGDGGGTDPALGFKGRHAVRSAWMAQNWGIGPGSSVIGSNAFSSKGPSRAGGLNVVEARLEFAQDYLAIALEIAEARSGDGKLHPDTILRLLSRHAGVLERIGSQASFFESRSELEKVWARLPAKGMDTARIALKLGDLNHRLGDHEDALTWWAKAIQLTLADKQRNVEDIAPVVPESAPVSPLAQRTLVSTLVSLSAFYATSGQLKQAKAIEESSLDLLRKITPSKSIKLASAPQTLHALYILHRSSLLSIHLAEVLYALRSSKSSSIEWLKTAAESSERVALNLTGLPYIHPDAPLSKIPHPPASEAPLLPAFVQSISMKKPATSLLRDARRTAAEAWNLMGILHEEASNTEKALECYGRALGWAGVPSDIPSGVAEPGEGILEVEWNVFWANYVRARNVVQKRQDKP